MSSSPISIPAALGSLRAAPVVAVRLVRYPELIVLVAIAATVNFWGLGVNGLGNDFYAAAARSMGSSWHNFLFASFDPAGLISAEKPPLALWAQVGSVKLVGFNSWGLLLPQALAGVATVAISWDLTRRHFGRAAGFAAGLILALTPIALAISRHNNPDALLMLCSAAAVWAALRATDDPRLRWPLLSGAFVGLGFETKMLAAALIVPALVAMWAWVGPAPRARARALAAAASAAVMTGLAWPLLVALTAPGDRPWLAGTSDNSIWSLITGYSGIDRLAGPDLQSGLPPLGTTYAGRPGPLRLLGVDFGPQIGWLLGLAVAGLVALAALTRLRRSDRRTAWLIGVGGSFATIAIVLSAARGIVYPYYAAQIAPFAACLAGAGLVTLARSPRSHAVAALLVAGAVEALVASRAHASGPAWALIAVGTLAGAITLLGSRRPSQRARLFGVAAAGLLIAPAIWSVATLGRAVGDQFPAAGPDPARVTGPGPRTTALRTAADYAAGAGGGAVAATRQFGPAERLIAEGRNVTALGGFSPWVGKVGDERIAAAVSAGRLGWVLGDDSTRTGDDDDPGTRALIAHVAAACASVPAGAWLPVRARTGSDAVDRADVTLYDCRGRADALRAPRP